VKIPCDSRLREGDHSNGEYASTHEELQIFLLSPQTRTRFCWANLAVVCPGRAQKEAIS